MNKLLITLLFLFVCVTVANTQTIKLFVENEPLSEVLFQLRDNYGVQFIFNPDDLKDCKITKNSSYNSADEAVDDLVKQCNLTYKKNGQVFIIIPAPQSVLTPVVQPKVYYTFTGFITDDKTGETLPSAIIKFKNRIISTDASGAFSFKNTDSVVNVIIQYLGYYQKDTIFSAIKNNVVNLISQETVIPQVVVNANTSIFDLHIGKKPANLSINHQITTFLPGSNNNTIFNMLRLQPGIQASGEQTNDFTIWGAYQGQNLITFDNITLYNINTFYDNISIIHPLMIKEINVFKGGFNVDYSNRVGGVVEIIGKNGNFNKLSGNFDLNNNAVSAYFNIPIAHKFSLQTAFRRTIPDFIDLKTDLKPKSNREFYIPLNTFKDFNIKFAGKLNQKNNFYISSFFNDDSQDYSYQKNALHIYSVQGEQVRKQNGSSFVYNKYFNNGSFLNLTSTVSDFNYFANSLMLLKNNNFSSDTTFIKSYSTNGVFETNLKTTYNTPAKGVNNFIFGTDFSYISTDFKRDTNDFNLISFASEGYKVGLFVIDQISLLGKIQINPGFRADYLSTTGKIYFQPRINFSFSFDKFIKLNASYGVYNQFISKNTLVDNMGNVLFLWNLSDNKSTKVQAAQHFTTGIIFNNKNFKISIETFFKKTDGISLMYFNKNVQQLIRSFGNSRALGADFYLKTKFKKHEMWFSYTLSQTLEHFSYFTDDYFQLAPQNQTHEFKGVLVLNFSPIYFSTSYVYGSGLEFTKLYNNGELIPYCRLDFAIMYKFSLLKTDIQIGASILNAFNTENIKYNDLVILPSNRIVYPKATPFTPMLNLNWKF